jgi:hypothetical protein
LCNLYSLTKGQQAIRDWAGVMNDRTGNLPPLPDIFPDYAAPIVRNQPEGRERAMVRWGMPSPVSALKDKRTDPELGSTSSLGVGIVCGCQFLGDWLYCRKAALAHNILCWWGRIAMCNPRAAGAAPRACNGR